MRGGLALSAGLIVCNLIGFFRVALTAYLLGTHSAADALAVAVGPIDTLNSVLINSMIFAFVPMLTAAAEGERTALFLKLVRPAITAHGLETRSNQPAAGVGLSLSFSLVHLPFRRRG